MVHCCCLPAGSARQCLGCRAASTGMVMGKGYPFVSVFVNVLVEGVDVLSGRLVVASLNHCIVFFFLHRFKWFREEWVVWKPWVSVLM